MTTDVTTDRLRSGLAAVFADAGVRGWLHAAQLFPGTPAAAREVALDADEAVPLASVWKLPLLVAYARAVDSGAVEPSARTVVPAPGRTVGGAGISLWQDAVTVSWRDLVTSMIAMSDNAAADAVYRRVGPRRIEEAMSSLGLRRTHVRGDSRSEVAALLSSTGTDTVEAAFGVLSDADLPTDSGAYSVLVASSSTAREISAVLTSLWTDTAASPQQCAAARLALSLRVGPHRLRLGFPLDSIAVAEKSGTVGALRHSAGVVQFDSGDAYVVTVFTRAARADRVLPRADEAIGLAAKVAVDALRAGAGAPVQPAPPGRSR